VARPTEAKVITAANVAWADGTLFQGYLLLVLGMPTRSAVAYTEVYLQGTDIHKWRVPTRVKIPIVDGVLSTSVRVWQNLDMVPTETDYSAYWYDDSGKSIATDDPSQFSITASSYTITPPTLSNNTAPASGGAP
jgi:hypothetical protein